MTLLGTSDLYVRLEKFTGGWAYAKYKEFSVADETDGYRMRVKVGSYQGNAGTYNNVKRSLIMIYRLYPKSIEALKTGLLCLFDCMLRHVPFENISLK